MSAAGSAPDVNAIATKDLRDLCVLMGIRQERRLAAGADRNILKEKRPLDHGGRKAKGVEIGPEGCEDRLLTLGLGDVTAIVALQYPCEHIGSALPSPEMQPAAPFCSAQSTRWSGPE